MWTSSVHLSFFLLINEPDHLSINTLEVYEMKKTSTMVIVALALMVLAITAVSAYRGDYTEKGPNYSADRHELMEHAFDNNDYDAWETMMTEDGRHPRVVDVVTPENFDIFVQAHEAGERGDNAEAAELRAELGLGNGNGMHDGNGRGDREGGMGQGKGMKDGSGRGNR